MLKQILCSMVKAFSLYFCGLFRSKIFNTLQWLPMVFYQYRLSIFVYPLLGVYARALHLPVIGRNAPGRKQESYHVHGFRGTGNKVENTFPVLLVGERIWLEGM